MHRNCVFRINQLRGKRCFLRVHREMAADRQQEQIWLVVIADQLHVREHVGIPGVIDRKTVLKLDDKPVRFASDVNLTFLGFGVLMRGASSGERIPNSANVSAGPAGPHIGTWFFFTSAGASATWSKC